MTTSTLERPTQKPPTPAPTPGPARALLTFLRDLVDLSEDKADELKIIEDIKRGVPFRGTNFWVLIFAIFIASIGLNVNSTAVIIGAMLISPLMGPIMGIGLGIGINDLELIKKGLFNLGVAVVISVMTSTLYFSVTPLADAQSELLARTQPTLWDVLIALFGGLAGIVAGSRREKSNAVPGVAIATALMPPLCTAGYGLATGNLYYFFGAFYLFFINSVFISLSTFLLVRYLKFPTKEFVDPQRERYVKTMISVFAVLTILPSIWTAYTVVRKSLFERSANAFIAQELQFDGAQVISRETEYWGDSSEVRVTLYGAPVSEELIRQAERELPQYGLEGATLCVRQGYTPQAGVDLNTVEQMSQNMRAGIIEELYSKNEAALRSKDERIALLEEELRKREAARLPVADICAELRTQHARLRTFSLSETVLTDLKANRQDTVTLAYARFSRRPKAAELDKMAAFLKVRTHADSLRLVVE